MTLRQQVFTSPGTWSWPGSVSQVEVVLVGGGGGGTSVAVVGGATNVAGGGGGYREVLVPVSAPVPVTVGAGGNGGPNQPGPTISTAGGTSSFGPVSVGGGGQGNASAPPTGGGAGGPGPVTGQPGTYGRPGYDGAGGAQVTNVLEGNLYRAANGTVEHYGVGGQENTTARWWGQPAYIASTPYAGVTGIGAGGHSSAASQTPGMGGTVIVRWFE